MFAGGGGGSRQSGGGGGGGCTTTKSDRFLGQLIHLRFDQLKLNRTE